MDKDLGNWAVVHCPACRKTAIAIPKAELISFKLAITQEGPHRILRDKSGKIIGVFCAMQESWDERGTNAPNSNAYSDPPAGLTVRFPCQLQNTKSG